MASAIKSTFTKSRSRAPSPDNGVPNPSETDKYLLRVTAGPDYDTSTHSIVDVNGIEPTYIENDLMKCCLRVRIRDYNGLPKSSPPSDPYFSHPMHTADLHSVAYSFVPKRPIAGSALVTGFNFDHSIRDRLPPGFKTAMRIVTTLLDPGIYADPYSDAPYLYGPALSSFFAFRIGEKEKKQSMQAQLENGSSVIEEGGDGSGQEVRERFGIPTSTNKRRKNFLKKEKLEEFVFEEGRMYQGDFFNPYLDFANFALKLPGFSISVVRYIDNKTHELRYVLKDRETEEVGLVVIFTLLFGEKMEDALATENDEQADRNSMTNSPSWEEKDDKKQITNGTNSIPNKQHDDEFLQLKNHNAPDGNLLDSQLPIRTRQSRDCYQSRERSPAQSESSEDSAPENASYLTSTLYSALSSLGFGPGSSSSASSSSKSSKESSPSRQHGLDRHVQGMENEDVENYLRSRNTST